MTELDLDESGFRQMIFVDEKTESEEDGSESAAQESEDEMNLDRSKEAEMLQNLVHEEQMFPSDGRQRELQMLESGGENGERAGGGGEDDWLTASEVESKNDDGLADSDYSETTWYFTWR